MMELVYNVILICVVFHGQCMAAAGPQDSIDTDASLDLSDQSPAIQKREETECVDTNEDCVGWAQSGECANNPSWMKTNCCDSCKTSKQARAECVDRIVAGGNCTRWAKDGDCVSNAWMSWMNINCCKSCGCQNVPTANNSCTVWAMSNYCSADYTYSGFVQERCRSTCAVCDKNSIIPQDSGTCGDWLSEDFCKDTNYNETSDCTKNPVFMFLACKKTCGGCEWLEKKLPECKFAKCEAWAAKGLCDLDPVFMNLYCKPVCDGTCTYQATDKVCDACRDRATESPISATEGPISATEGLS